jgi:hypothetical protein
MSVGLMTKEERGEGMRRCRNLGTTDDNNEKDEEGVVEEGLASSSDDDADSIVDMVVRGKRTRTRNPRVFNDDFL